MTGLALVLTSASSRGEREFSISISSGGGVAGSGVGPGPDDQDDGFVQGAAPGVTFTIWVVLLTAVLGTGLAKLAEGDGVAAGFGEEVAAVAEHVCSLPEPGVTGLAFAAELPRGDDHLPVVGRAAKAGDLDRVPDTGVGQPWSGEGLGGVLGDVVRDGLTVERLAGARDRIAPDRPGVGLRAEPEQDGADLASIGGDADGGGGPADGVAQQVGGVPGGRGLVVLAGGIEPDDGVEWTTPRAWYSATLTYRTRRSARSSLPVTPARRAR